MTDDKNWKPCPHGTIQSVAEQQSESDRAETMTRRAAFSMVMTVGAGIGFAIWSRTLTAGLLTCNQTMALAERFVLGQLTPQESSAVESHCRKCRPCADHIAEMREQTV